MNVKISYILSNDLVLFCNIYFFLVGFIALHVEISKQSVEKGVLNFIHPTWDEKEDRCSKSH